MRRSALSTERAGRADCILQTWDKGGVKGSSVRLSISAPKRHHSPSQAQASQCGVRRGLAAEGELVLRKRWGQIVPVGVVLDHAEIHSTERFPRNGGVAGRGQAATCAWRRGEKRRRGGYPTVALRRISGGRQEQLWQTRHGQQ
eukprot:scaffold38839_cov64-Phaeocystis_antarctica.AAC.2